MLKLILKKSPPKCHFTAQKTLKIFKHLKIHQKNVDVRILSSEMVNRILLEYQFNFQKTRKTIDKSLKCLKIAEKNLKKSSNLIQKGRKFFFKYRCTVKKN